MNALLRIKEFIREQWPNYLVEWTAGLLLIMGTWLLRHSIWRYFLRPLLTRLFKILQELFDKFGLIGPASFFANFYDRLFEQKLREKKAHKLIELRRIVGETINEIEAALVKDYGNQVKRWTNRIKFKIKEINMDIDAIIGGGKDLWAEIERMVIDEWFRIPKGTPKGIAEFIESRFLELFRENVEKSELFSKLVSRKASPKPVEGVIKTPDVVIHYAPGWLEQEFRGRQDELQLLDKWLRDGQKRIMVIEAIGGTGKTMLTYHWLTNHVLTEGLQISPKLRAEIGLEKVFWWSIYESKVTFDKFLMDVLEANGVDTGKLAGKVGEMVDKVVGLCRKKKMLFVLDGFERMLVAYNRMDAAYLGDETADTSPKARQIYDEQVKRLVESFLDETIRSKLILTTRLMPSSRIESSRGIVEHLELKGLDRENAIAMLREVLPDAPKTELIAILERIGNDELGYNPLTIALVVGGLAVVPKNERLSEARKLVESLIADEEAFRGEMEKLGITVSESERYARARNHILHYRYKSMPENLREFASRLAALRGSIDFELARVLGMTKLHWWSKRLFKNESQVRDALKSLVRQRILMLSGDTYDFHPIVRKFFYERLGDKGNIHGKLVDYFSKFPEPQQIERIEDLNPVIELYHHLIRAEKYDEAGRLFYNRLEELTYYRFGAYRLMIQLLSGLFESGEVFDGVGNIRRLLI